MAVTLKCMHKIRKSPFTETHTAKEIEKELKTHIEKNSDTCNMGWAEMELYGTAKERKASYDLVDD